MWKEKISLIEKNKLWVKTNTSTCTHYHIDANNRIIYKKYLAYGL